MSETSDLSGSSKCNLLNDPGNILLVFLVCIFEQIFFPFFALFLNC